MKCTKVNKKVQKSLQHLLNQYPRILNIVRAIDRSSGVSLLVGGAVRDLLLGLPIHDFDIEVHNLSVQDLEKVLKKFGTVSLVGKSYGVLRVHGIDADWSVPRTDSKGRKPKVIINPTMGFKEAFRRRDLTINAMGINLMTYELIDPFNGMCDLKKKILRAPDVHKFIEDPLRFFRVMQFIGRFNMRPDAQLNNLCKKMDIKHVSKERIDEEFKKLMLKSQQPSLGLRWLHAIKRLKDVLPEVADLVDVQQEPEWHPEGNVFEHTMQTIDAAAQLDYDNDQQKLLIMYATLCHDLGKAKTTKIIKGRIRSLGHEQVSATLTPHLLSHITTHKELVHNVKALAVHHMAPGQFIRNNAGLAAYKRLAHTLGPDLTLKDLALLALADRRGRNSRGHKPLKKKIKDIEEFLQQARKANVLHAAEEPLLKGKDVMDMVSPGPSMGRLLKKAYEIQLKEGIKDKAELKKRIK